MKNRPYGAGAGFDSSWHHLGHITYSVPTWSDCSQWTSKLYQITKLFVPLSCSWLYLDAASLLRAYRRQLGLSTCVCVSTYSDAHENMIFAVCVRIFVLLLCWHKVETCHLVAVRCYIVTNINIECKTRIFVCITSFLYAILVRTKPPGL